MLQATLEAVWQLLLKCISFIQHLLPIKQNQPSQEAKEDFDDYDSDEDADFNAQARRMLPEYDGPRADGDIASFTLQDSPTMMAEIPSEPRDAIKRILKCNPRDLYGIIGVPWGSPPDVVKRMYRKQSLKVHPDKTTIVKAPAAFQRLSKAYDILSDEMARDNYHMEVQLMSNEHRAYMKQLDRAEKEYYRQIDEMRTSLLCNRCGRMHPKLKTDRSPFKARWCQDCNTHHNAKEGEVWLETKGIFSSAWQGFMCMDGEVYSVNDWVECQVRGCPSHLSLFDMVPDVQDNRSHGSFLFVMEYASATGVSQSGPAQRTQSISKAQASQKD
eukprot:TRINITY_DN4413_c0_g1_i3.p1 TRINITY_DN4413_c0_g1~~TRINITY_DN4413_c0_g1_i3.p1  ORF type:complete len:329 (+),score=30.26 TRINITY_DN4413_c0_g1_i3:49-1035(+)